MYRQITFSLTLSLSLFLSIKPGINAYNRLERHDKTIFIFSDKSSTDNNFNFNVLIKNIEGNKKIKLLVLTPQNISTFQTQSHRIISNNTPNKQNAFMPTYVSSIFAPCEQALETDYFKNKVSHLSLSRFNDYKKLITRLNKCKKNWSQFYTNFLEGKTNMTWTGFCNQLSNYETFCTSFNKNYFNIIVPLEGLFSIFESKQKKVIIHVDDHFSKILLEWLKEFGFEQKMSVVFNQKTKKSIQRDIMTNL